MTFFPRLLAGLAVCGVLGSPVTILAQGSGDSSSSAATNPSSLSVLISAPDDSPVGRPILLDGSASRVVGDDIRYAWYVNDNETPISTSVDAIYTPEQPGHVRFRLVIRSLVEGVQQRAESEKELTVYRRKMVLVADPEVGEEKLALHQNAAEQNGVYLKILRLPEPKLTTRLQDAWLATLQDRETDFRGSEAVMFWTDAANGAQLLTQAFRGDSAVLSDIRNQSMVLVTNRRLWTVAQTTQAFFPILRPQRIVLLQPAALLPFLEARSIPSFLRDAEIRGIQAVTIDESTQVSYSWRMLSRLVSYMLSNGLSSQTILLLLMLPVIATILSFLKQVIGVTTFGLFAPSIIALSFLVLGWWLGTLFFLFIVTTGYLSRAFMSRLHILYIPKVAIIITIVSLTLLLLLGINVWFGMVISRDTVFVLLIMSTLAESFLTAKSEQGTISAISGIAQTLFAALLCVSIVQIPSFQVLVLAYPELLLITILLNILIGRYTGLRLSEYFRFREVFRHMAQE